MRLDTHLNNYSLSKQNRRLVYIICYGVLRHFFYLSHIFELYAQGKSKAKVRVLGIIGLYQIIFMHKPLYATINETVNACNELKCLNAKSFINGLLRHLSKDNLSPVKNFQELPDWLYGKLKKHYPTKLDDIVKCSNIKGPIFLRLNQQKDQATFLKMLKQKDICYHKTDTPNCISLNQPQNIITLPLFAEGFFSVQDQSAQLAAHILEPMHGDKILDACAAPGGKSTHLLELCPEIELTIMDSNTKRFERIKENLARLKLNDLNIKLAIHDATKDLNPKLKFDKILIDAPCSSTGVIRRNPDIKVLRTPKDVKEIIEIQKHILENLAQYIKPKGLLLYSTCSILPEENEKQIKQFIKNHPQFKAVKIPMLEPSLKQQYGYQIFPTINGGDGFYYCLLQALK